MSRGIMGQAPFVIFLIIWGDEPPKFCSSLAVQSLLALLTKFYDQFCTAYWLLRHLILLSILYLYQSKVPYSIF